VIEADLDLLQRTLNSNEYQEIQSSFQDALLESGKQWPIDKLNQYEWRALCLPGKHWKKLHSNTVNRLEKSEYQTPLSAPEGLFKALSQLEPSLSEVLKMIWQEQHEGIAIFRRKPVYAPGGYTRKAFVYPDAGVIGGALATLEQMRTNDFYLSGSVWRAALLYLLVLRLHPFQDGNGRAARVLFSYELWRMGVMHSGVIPFKKTLDANRILEIRGNLALSTSESIDSATFSLARVLLFIVRIAEKTLRVFCR